MPSILRQFEDPITTHTSNSGFAGRVYAGYQLASNLGFEIGYAKYANSHASVKNELSEFAAKNRTSAIDALAVLTLPVASTVSLNAKAGVAYVINHYEVNEVTASSSEIVTNKTRTFRPKFAVGADYNFTDNIALGLAYEVTPGVGQPIEIPNLELEASSHYSPLIQMVAVNLKYSF